MLLAKAGARVILTDLDDVAPLLATNASHAMGYEHVTVARGGEALPAPEPGCVVVGAWDFSEAPPPFVFGSDVPAPGAEARCAEELASEPYSGVGPRPEEVRAAAAASAQPAASVRPHFVVGSDVLYAESLIRPLLDGVASLLGPSTVAILANERRCEDTYEAFLEACRERFVTRLVPRRQMPEGSPESMYIVELRKKRR